jgi:hypothetical protein
MPLSTDGWDMAYRVSSEEDDITQAQDNRLRSAL